MRSLARARLEQVLEKVAPLLVVVDADPARALASEDVHDFRVSVRRLRSWLRACEPLLGGDVPRARRNALRKLARRAGRARDAQVQCQWLAALPVPRTAGAIRAAAWYAALRADDFAKEYARLQEIVTARWPDLAAALGEALRDPPVTHAGVEAAPADREELLTAHLGAVIARQAVVAQEALDRIEHVSQVREIHRARIEVKRLRYVVEAIQTGTPAERATVKSLKRLQDSLGTVHDAHVLTSRVDETMSQPRRRGMARPALRDLRALRAALRRAELAAYRAALDQLATRRMTAMWTAVAALARRLSSRAPSVDATARRRAPASPARPLTLPPRTPCASSSSKTTVS